MKGFLQWCGLKQKLHESRARGPFVRERDLWWVSLGENIGSEINGKSDLYSRPAIILKKLAHGFFLVAPTTTKNHEGTWYVPIVYNEKKTCVCLYQIRTIDYRRLSSRIGQISGDDFENVKRGFKIFIAKNIPHYC
jgi:mRNA interferase MazF